MHPDLLKGHHHMSMTILEKAIWLEAKTVLNNPKLKLKDIQEWSTSEILFHEGEVVVQVPDLKVYIAVKVECDKRVKT